MLTQYEMIQLMWNDPMCNNSKLSMFQSMCNDSIMCNAPMCSDQMCNDPICYNPYVLWPNKICNDQMCNFFNEQWAYVQCSNVL